VIRRRNWLIAWLATFMLLAQLPTAGVESAADHIHRSSQFLAQGDLAAAEREANLALSTPSSRPLAYAALGAIRLKQKKYSESQDFLKRAIELNPRLVGARLNLGNVYLVRRQIDLAANVFRSVLKLDPANAAARLSQAQVESEKGRYSLSLDLVKPILPSLRQTPDGLLLLAANYLGLGDVASARACCPTGKGLLPKQTWRRVSRCCWLGTT
jgi:tetratricopeptide (TPR) repeat protein